MKERDISFYNPYILISKKNADKELVAQVRDLSACIVIHIKINR